MQKQPSVLVADPDDALRSATRTSLEAAGLEVHEANTGRAALAALRGRSHDALILAQNLPDTPGLELCAHLRSQPESEHLPILMIIDDDLDSIPGCYSAGATDFVRRPVNWLVLVQRVRFILRSSAAFADLRESQSDLAEAQRMAKLGHWTYDFSSSELSFSPECYRIFGLPEGTPLDFAVLLGQIHPDDRERVGREMAVSHEERTSCRIDHRITAEGEAERVVHMQGELRCDAFGKASGMRGSIQDFHRTLRSGTSPTTGAEHGLHVTEWCAAATRGLEPSTARPAVTTDGVEARPGEVCVLGANGFIGRRTVAALLERDLPVTAVVRRLDGLPPVLTEGVKDGRVRLLRASLTDPDALRRAIHGARVVVHLATGGGDSWQDLERAMVHGTRDVAEACLDEGVERLVYVSSTAALYLGRDAGRDLSDSVGPDPRPELRALYARGKEAAERELMRLHRERRLPVTIVRPAVVLGQGAPLQHSGIGLWVRDNHCVGWGPGRDPIPVVLVEDVGDALARLAAHAGSDLDGRGLNLASNAALTPRDIVAAYRARTGRAFHFHPRSLVLSQAMEVGKYVVKKVGGRRDAEPPHFRDLKSRELYPRLLCERARDVLGWRPCDDADEFLRRYLGGPG